jgi:hypothetical protein
MRKSSLLFLLKDIETVSSDPNPQKDLEKADLSQLTEGSSRGKSGRRPRRSKKVPGVAPQ